MKKDTVLFVYHALRIGGVEKELLAYIRHLDAKKFSIHLALTRVAGELLPELPPYVHIHKVIGDSVKPNIRYLVNLYRVIYRIRPAVVVGFMQDICFNILLIHKFSPVRFQVIVSEHIVLSRWQKVLRTNWVKARLVPMLYKNAVIIAAHGESVLHDLKTSFRVDVSKVRLIPSYIESRRYPFIKKNHRNSTAYSAGLSVYGKTCTGKKISTYYSLRFKPPLIRSPACSSCWLESDRQNHTDK